MDSEMIQLFVLAAIALFLVLRLRNVLGTRGGFEKPDGALPIPVPAARAKAAADRIPGEADPDIAEFVAPDSPSASALAALKQAEPEFSVADFMRGAAAAYEMVVMGFETGELGDLRDLLSTEVLAGFETAVQDRRSRGLTVEAKFIGLRDSKLAEARFDRATRTAEITVSFVCELHVVIRDAAGAVVEGDPNGIRRQGDSFTFERIAGSPGPNWVVIATGN